MDEKLLVASVDDDEDFLKEVKHSLNGADSCFEVKTYTSPEEFFRDPPKDNSLLVFDEYFPEAGYPSREGRPRAGELIEFSLKHLPNARFVIYSNNPIEQYIARAEVVNGWADKSKSGSLHAAIAAAIDQMPAVSPDLKARCLTHLQRKEQGATPSEPEMLPEILMGRILYPFQRSLPIESGWDAQRENSFFRLKDYPTFIVGEGDFLVDARASFSARFHERYKQLEQQRTIYDAPEDSENRLIFANIVNQEEYHNLRTLIVPFLFGKIEEILKDGARIISWHGISIRSVHSLSEAASLANIKPGSWIRAVVEKRMSTEAIVSILDASEVIAPIVDEQIRADFWNTSPKITS